MVPPSVGIVATRLCLRWRVVQPSWYRARTILTRQAEGQQWQSHLPRTHCHLLQSSKATTLSLPWPRAASAILICPTEASRRSLAPRLPHRPRQRDHSRCSDQHAHPVGDWPSSPSLLPCFSSAFPPVFLPCYKQNQ